MLAQYLDQLLSDHHTFVCLERQFRQRAALLPVFPASEGAIVKCRLQFERMFAPRLVALGIFGPCCRIDAQLPRYIRQKFVGRRCIGGHRVAGIAQVAELDSEAEPIVRPTPLANDRQVAFVKSVMPRNLHIGAWKCEQRFLLDGGKK